MRFHVVSLPHTQATAEFSACAYTMKVIGFCRMMKSLGHTVFLYAVGAKSNAPSDELIPCLNENERQAVVADLPHYTAAPFDPSLPHWRKFNSAAAAAIIERAEPRDFLCLIGGNAHKPIDQMVRYLMAVEFGVGYGGVFSNFRVFESYAWMHAVYGALAGPGEVHRVTGNFYDAVIPGYLDPDQFPLRAEKDDYFLFMGRLDAQKGLDVAMQAAAAAKVRLIVAGPGTAPDGVEYAGVVSPFQRGELLSRARALFAPTLYLEPFGNVVIEAMACGTPVITTDWGAFTETVAHAETGFRCRTLQEFVDAAGRLNRLLPAADIRARVEARYSLDVVGAQYEAYFERLTGLYGDGWGAVAA